MRTIDPILKSACQTGNGLPIASAIIRSLATTPLADQSFTVVKYDVHSEEITATLKGSELPNYGKLIISRGYQVGTTEYTEPLPQFFIHKVVALNDSEYEVTANAFPNISNKDFSAGNNVKNTILGAETYNVNIEITEDSDPSSIFLAFVNAPDTFPSLKSMLYSVGHWPLIRYYLTETGVSACSMLSDIANITEITIVNKRNIRFYDWVIGIYMWGSTPFRPIDYITDQSRITGSAIAYFDPTGLIPDFETTIAKYYNERDNAALFQLLADMELEEGDRFEYDGYTWRIESITEKYGNEFTQSLFCLRIIPPYYLLLEIGDNILLESGDDLLME